MSTASKAQYRRVFSIKGKTADKGKATSEIEVSGKTFVDYLKNFRKEAKKHPEIGRKVLTNAGIIDKNGRLTAPYK